MKNALFPVLAALLLIPMLGGCASARSPAAAVPEQSDEQQNEQQEEVQMECRNPVAEITMADGGVITIELRYDIAPNTVRNFISLANSGFYDGVIFHRVIPGFMIQGGDPTGTGMGGPDYRIKGEFTNNHVKNDLSHARGVVSMARQGNPYMPASAYNTAGSQFFICHADAKFLDGDYAAFGIVTDGMDVVDRIASVPTDANDRPRTDQIMKTVRVDAFGQDLGEPEVIR